MSRKGYRGLMTYEQEEERRRILVAVVAYGAGLLSGALALGAAWWVLMI